MGSLDIPNETFLNECLPLESSSNVKSNIILCMTYYGNLGPNKKFCIALNRCCSVHVFGWQNIKEIIPYFDSYHLHCTLAT